MTRYAPFLSLLLPFNLLVWRPEWTSVVALGLWTALAALYLGALLFGDKWASERSAALDDRALGEVLSLTDRMSALEMRMVALDLHATELLHLKERMATLTTTGNAYMDGLSSRLAKAERNIDSLTTTRPAPKGPPL